MQTQIIAIGCDHAGFQYKEAIVKFLIEQNMEVHDFGTFTEDSVDYPDFAHQVATSIETKESEFGILICGSGNGVCITANKHQKVRAALVWNSELAALSRKHNNANVVCLPARFISLDESKECVDVFLKTEFEGGRHEKRISKI